MIKLVYPEFWSRRGWISNLLMPFSYIYRALGCLRKCLVKPIRLNSMVVCVGNFSVGGAGKTQLVLWLAKKLNQKKAKYLIVTKAYGSNLQGAKIVEQGDLASEVGDESVVLRKHAPVLASKTIKDAIPFIDKIKPDIVIFDDGMQNPGFIKDLSLLVIDTVRSSGNDRIFPAGPLRESVESALSRSDIVTLIGNDSSQDFSLQNKIEDSARPVFKAQIKLTQSMDISKKYYAFTAIGNPDRFYNLLKAQGVILAGVQSFPDHHNYTKDELYNLKNSAEKLGCSLITTRKDYVKISDKDQIICADVALEFENETKLFDQIYEKIRQKT